MSEPTKTGERIAKVIARAGLCSRRDAERWIAEGRVRVDGKVISSPALNVTAQSGIEVDGKPLPQAEASRMWRYHKPRGRLTTRRDPRGRPTIHIDLPPELANAITIGRLDMNSEGLLLLTNDGAMARRLELPKTGWLRRYRARVHGRVDADALKTLARGVTVEGVTYGPVTATLERQVASNAWVTVSLREGRNREVRRLLEHLGYTVNRLIRTDYGPFRLGDLAPGAIEEIPARYIADQVPKA